MSFGKVYSYAANPRCRRILSVAKLSGVEIEEVNISVPDLKAQYSDKYPICTVPAFEGADGFYLTETAAICEYIARKSGSSLLPSDAETLAQVQQWVCMIDQDVIARFNPVTAMFNNRIPYNKVGYQIVVDAVMRKLDCLNKHLQTRTFVVGERITVADITIASALTPLFSGHIDASLREKIPNVVRLVETIYKSSKLAPIFGEITYSQTAPQYQPPKKEAPAKPAAAPAAPKEKAPKPSKKAEEDDEEEPDVPAEPKAKNPLDDLPKSDFKMDDWKRTYSNEDTKTVAIPWFYKNFDKEGYSIWRVDYKYNDELTQVFMSSNLIGGFFNRLEASRKYAFGSAGVFGKANDSVIAGVFVVRGKDYKPVLEVAPDVDSYAFKEIDLENPEDKAFFEGALAWDLEVAGKPFADGKIFK